MTLDEAIDFSENEAKRIERKSCSEWVQELQIKESANRFRQLAEWLRELKKYRIAHWKLRDMDYEYDFNSNFGDNPMYYGEKVWDLFGDIDASVEYEVMGYEEVNADKGVLEKINEKQDSLRATCKAWDEAIEKDGYVD